MTVLSITFAFDCGVQRSSPNQPCTPGCSPWGAAGFGPTRGHSCLAAVLCRSERRSPSQVTALSWVTCRTGRHPCCWSPAKASFQGWSLRPQSKCCTSGEGLLRAKSCCTRVQAALELMGSPRELPPMLHLGSLSTQNGESVMVTWNYPKLFSSSRSGISHFPRGRLFLYDNNTDKSSKIHWAMVWLLAQLYWQHVHV